MPPHASPPPAESTELTRSFLGVFRYSGRAIELVWSTSHALTVALALLTLVAGLLPAGVAFVGAHIVDAVVNASKVWAASGSAPLRPVFEWVALEGVLVAALAGAQRGLSLCQSLLRAQLGQRVNVMILEKALTLELAHFEDSEFYDKLTRARREASSRPLSLVTRTFGLGQNAISLLSYGTLLFQFSPWAVAVLLLAGLPAFFAETKFSGDAFRLFRWRSPETRMQLYLETVLAREDHAKEVKLFGLGPLLLQRYRDIFHTLYRADRDLAVRRDSWGFVLGLLGTLALYGAYAWIAASTVMARITLGQMTMYLPLFRQGQSAVSAMLSAIGGMYEDNLYLSTLYEYLETPVPTRHRPGAARRQARRRHPLRAGQLHLPRRQRTRAARHRPAHPTRRIAGPGRPKWFRQDHPDQAAHAPVHARPRPHPARRHRPARVGRGRAAAAHRRDLPGLRPLPDARGRKRRRWRRQPFRGRGTLARGRDKGMASDFIDSLPAGFETQLGKWFNDGRELSGGQWQKIALARAFMRSRADILVLDEPTAAMDAQAEATIFEHFRELSGGRIAILISHRFSTVRMADQIIVIQDGRIIERGDHEQLMAESGHYAHLFSLQAQGYR